MFEHSMAIQPSYFVYSNLATLYYYEGRYEDAARMYRETMQYNDQDYQTWGQLAAAYYWASGSHDKAMPAYQRAIEMAEELLREVNQNDAEVLSRLATYYVDVGEHDKARSRIELALDLAPEDDDVLLRASYAYERLGDRETALQWMGKMLAHGRTLAFVKSQHEPGFRELRSDPRFQQLLQDSSDAR